MLPKAPPVDVAMVTLPARPTIQQKKLERRARVEYASNLDAMGRHP
jgi:hypothetical protein